MHSLNLYLQAALLKYPVLTRHQYIAEAITLLGSDNHTATCYYPTAEFYLTKHADKWNIERLEAAAKAAYANDYLELMVCGEHSEMLALIKGNAELEYLDRFLDTVFGETDDSDSEAPMGS